MLLEFEVSPLLKADIPFVAEIEQHNQPEPWTARSFAEELDRLHSKVLVARVKAVQQPTAGEKPPEPGTIVGYICFWRIFGELQILNLVVDRSFRRRGTARLLLDRAIDFGREAKADHATLEVREGNVAARGLYESVGFRPVGERSGYYGANEEAAIIMELELNDRRV